MIIKFKTIDLDELFRHDFVARVEDDEVIPDFHLFCLSIVNDLINGRQRFNELEKPYTYDFDFTPSQKQEFLTFLDYTKNQILYEKLTFKDELNKLINE